MPIFRDTPGLLDRFRAGSREAMEQVYWAYAARIAAIIRRGFNVKNEQRVPGVRGEQLEDLVQEVFTKAFSERARLAYDGLRDYGPFLFTIARNVVIDWARKNGREIPVEHLQEYEMLESSSEPDDAPWADPFTTTIVEAYLRELPPELADVHRERYILGRPQREAAAALGITRHQLRSREQKLCEGLDVALRKAETKTNAKGNPIKPFPRIKE